MPRLSITEAVRDKRDGANLVFCVFALLGLSAFGAVAILPSSGFDISGAHRLDQEIQGIHFVVDGVPDGSYTEPEPGLESRRYMAENYQIYNTTVDDERITVVIPKATFEPKDLAEFPHYVGVGARPTTKCGTSCTSLIYAGKKFGIMAR